MLDWTNCLPKGSDVATLQCIPYVFANIVNFLLMAAGTMAFLVILLSGLRFILAHGDAKQLDSARKTFVYAILGLIVILCSYIVLNIITTITGVNCILAFGPFQLSTVINGHGYTNCFAQ